MVEEEDGKGLQKVETKRQKRAIQKGENGDKWTANKKKESLQKEGLKGCKKETGKPTRAKAK